MYMKGGIRARVVVLAGPSRQGHHGNHGGGFVRKSVCPPERVLRYPDGKVRRIRYPCLTGPTLVACPRFEERLNTPTGGPSTTEEVVENGTDGERAELDLSSPLAFLRYVTSEEYTRRLEEENTVVRGTFDVHTSCPWVVPKKVWTLCVDGGHQYVDDDNDDDEERFLDRVPAATSIFYLRARSPQTEVESELNSLLFSDSRKRKDKIRCSSLVDGVVLFTEESDAEAFAESMSIDASRTVSVAEHDSHELFRHIVECRSVAVVMKPRFGEEMGAHGMEMRGFPERLKAVLLEWRDDEEKDEGDEGDVAGDAGNEI